MIILSLPRREVANEESVRGGYNVLDAEDKKKLTKDFGTAEKTGRDPFAGVNTLRRRRMFSRFSLDLNHCFNLKESTFLQFKSNKATFFQRLCTTRARIKTEGKKPQ